MGARKPARGKRAEYRNIISYGLRYRKRYGSTGRASGYNRKVAVRDRLPLQQLKEYGTERNKSCNPRHCR
nr:MAG TPA: hypothetical protein [Caudoviricetes sp.]